MCVTQDPYEFNSNSVGCQSFERIVGQTENAVPERVSGGDHFRPFAERLPIPRVPVLINDARASSWNSFVETTDDESNEKSHWL